MVKKKYMKTEDYRYVLKKPLDTLGRIRPMVYLFWKGVLVRKLTLAEVRTAITEDAALAADVDLQEFIARKNAEGQNKNVVNQYTNKRVSTELKGRELYLYLENLMFNNNRI